MTHIGVPSFKGALFISLKKTQIFFKTLLTNVGYMDIL